MDSIRRDVYAKKAEGYRWLAGELARVAREVRAEVERLWGPDRGE